MQVTNTSWHFKVATEHGGLTHENGFKYPTLCNYVCCVLSGIFMYLLDKVVLKFILPVAVDMLLVGAFYLIFFSSLPLIICIIGGFTVILYFCAVKQFYIDCGLYLGPLCVLKNIVDFKFIKIILAKLCQPVKIIYVKDEN